MRLPDVPAGSNGRDGRDKVIGSSQGQDLLDIYIPCQGGSSCAMNIVLLASAVKFVRAHHDG